jgi:hypothetical protein
VIAHVGGLPVEEFLPALMSGVGAIWVATRARTGRRARPDRSSPSASGR